jgi:Tfp pilus assembly protein PilN
MIEINLLPGGGKKTRQRGTPSLKVPAMFAGLRGTGGPRDTWLLAAIACAVIGVGGLSYLYVTQAHRDAKLAESLEHAVADSTRYAGVLRDRVRAEATRDTVLRQLNIIRAVDGDRYIWPHLLDEMSRALPPYTWLTGVTYAGTSQGSAARQIVTASSAPAPAPAKSDSTAGDATKAAPRLATTIPLDTVTLRITGQTVDIQALTRFMRDLEQSPFIERVQLEKSELVIVQQKEATQFSLLALFTRPDSTQVRRVALTANTR